MCGQHNVRATARYNTGQNKEKGQMPSPKIGIKISDPAGNRTKVARLERRDSTDHAMVADNNSSCFWKMKNHSSMRGFCKVSFPLVPQTVNHLRRLFTRSWQHIFLLKTESLTGMLQHTIKTLVL